MRQKNRIVWWAYLLATAVALVAAIILIAEVAQAQSIEIPLESIVRGPDGSIHRVAGPLEVGETGAVCTVELTRIMNNRSDHDFTNIIVQSGSSTAKFINVEVPDWSGAGVGGFVLDGPVEVFTQVGPDEVSSMGYEVEIHCPTVTTTTTPAETTTTTMEPPGVTTTVPQTTTSTTEPAPVGGVETGGGATAAVIVNGQDPEILLALGIGLFIAAGLLVIGVVISAIRARR